MDDTRDAYDTAAAARDDTNFTGGHKLRFTWRIDAGHLLQAAVIIVGCITYLVGFSSKTDQAIEGVKRLETTVQGFTTKQEQSLTEFSIRNNQNLATVQETFNKGVAEVKQQIDKLPDMNARVTALERQSTGTDRVIQQLSDKIEVVNQRSIGTAATVENLRNASGVPLTRSVR